MAVEPQPQPEPPCGAQPDPAIEAAIAGEHYSGPGLAVSEQLPIKLDLRNAPSAMEQLAASWRKERAA